ncbi:hypothetical protein K474DRAFT_1617476 [Panus rudis PR-1116 ss-1]|nr:hypothetical protein K474DRAFT_1617476 [Panus rudis PR-1116 ss-1]
MASWKRSFEHGITLFKDGKHEDALSHFTTAIALGAKDPIVYESRAAVYEKLGRLKESLLDSKKAIDLNPQRWQGYARSARLFLKLHKFDRAELMLDMAVERIQPDDTTRMHQLSAVRRQLEDARDAFDKQKREILSKTCYHFGKLPFEIAHIIFSLVVDEEDFQIVTLAQVCKNWRATILNTPALWTTLHLTHKSPLKKVQAWKQRCQGRLQRMSFRGDVDDRILTQIADCDFSRLRELNVAHMRLSKILRALPSLSPEVIRNLESLELGTLTEPKDALSIWSHADLQMRRLAVAHTKIYWQGLCQNASHLRHFSYQGPFSSTHTDTNCLLHLLALNQELSTMQLYAWESDASPIFPVNDPNPLEIPSTIHLAKLTELDFGGNAISPSNLIPRLHLPNIAKLVFIRTRVSPREALDSLIASNSLGRLVELRLQASFVHRETLISVLHHASQLEILEYSRCGELDVVHVAEALAQSADDGLLCPKLVHLDLSRSSQLQQGPIVRLVKNRLLAIEQNLPVSKIETLILDGCPLMDPSLLPWIRSKVSHVSCIFQSKKEARWRR